MLPVVVGLLLVWLTNDVLDIYAKRIRTWALFSVDFRSLAALRIGVALCFLVDVYLRSLDYDAFFAMEPDLIKGQFSLFYWYHGTRLWEIFVFLFSFLVGISLLIGWKTQISSILVYICILSFQNR
jgi:hypothetical protein